MYAIFIFYTSLNENLIKDEGTLYVIVITSFEQLTLPVKKSHALDLNLFECRAGAIQPIRYKAIQEHVLIRECDSIGTTDE